MSYYGVEPWQNQSRQASWEHPPSRSGASSSTGARDETAASFSAQLEEVERAIENLARSGKLGPAGAGGNASFRRDPMMMGGSPAPGGTPTGPRGGDFAGPGHHGPPPPRHHSVSDFDQRQSGHGPSHPHGHGANHGPHNSSNVQGFYQNQRYGGAQGGPHGVQPGSRKSEADQMQQAQRRMAAQRERELRNYHQEQQYNRGKPERTMSPNMSEDERRELIARQHRALYGDEHNSGPFDANSAELPQGAGPSPPSGINNTPPIGAQGVNSAPRTSTNSPKDLAPVGSSSPSRQHVKTGSIGPSGPVAPIGTRPTAGSVSQGKRPTPPTTSPLGIPGADRAPSSASNPSKEKNSSGGTPNTWGNSSAVWGKNPLGVQASVWG